MSIEITIVKSPSNLPVAKPYHIFTEQGGTIGRGADNAWTVEDPEKFISSRHSQIVFEHGQYYLMDVSTNGTFLNGSHEPVGHGNRVPLKDGDRFALGEYEFLVSMRNGAGAPALANDPFGDPAFASGGGGAQGDVLDVLSGPRNDPFADMSPTFDSPIAPLLTPGYVENDPLQALDKAAGRHASAPVFHGHGNGVSQPDNADPLQHAMKWPSAFPDPTAAIPEDWYNDDASAAAPSVPPLATPASALADARLMQRLHAAEQRCAALEAERQKLMGHIKALTTQQRNARAAGAIPAESPRPVAADADLIAAMGLSKWDLAPHKKAEISHIAGAIVRETMEGLMQALAFRKKIKEEFRINVTTIQPVENNPLKFSANLEDALENMFVKENKAYQKPLDAVREGFHGISEHQLAVLAGMQAAFRGMIDRLDPTALEQRFEKYRKAGVIKVGQKAKNWESYKEFHKDLVDDIDNSFQHLFGYDFVQAYEEQLQRLAVARKARAKSAKE